MTTQEIAKEITIALVNKLGAQSSSSLKTTSEKIGEAFKIIAKAIQESYD
jgi:hypothetical protein